MNSPWNSPGQNTGVGSCSLLQVIFPTQGSNPGPHCRWILYHLSHQGSLSILEWVPYPFSSGSFWPRNQTGSPALQAIFFTSWATRGALRQSYSAYKICSCFLLLVNLGTIKLYVLFFHLWWGCILSMRAGHGEQLFLSGCWLLAGFSVLWGEDVHRFWGFDICDI